MTKISNQYSLTNILTADLANSRLGINNVSPTVALDVTGGAKISASITAQSLFVTNGNNGVITLGGAIYYGTIAHDASVTGANIYNVAAASGGGHNFQIGGSEKMRITSAGKVGIGLTAPGGKLDVQDTGTVAPANGQPGTGFNVRRSDGVLGVAIGYNDDPSTFYIQSNRMDGGVGIAYNLALSPVRGNVLIATYTDNGYKLYVNGNAAGPSGFANVSDRRLKKDITPIESALNKVKLLNGVSFNWDKTLRPDLALDDKNHLGLIAQDVEEILPQVVTTGIDELKTKTITYSDIVPVLIEAIKELSAKVSLLENK